MNSANNLAIFWFRRDLRLFDNAGLYHALKSGYSVLPIFIFDTNILNQLSNKADQRVTFIYSKIVELNAQLKQLGSGVKVFYNKPENVFKELLHTYNIKAVYTNTDYEPYAIKRDEIIQQLLKKYDIAFNAYKDQCIFEKNEIVKPNGNPYTVFTPYSKKWKEKLNCFYLKAYPSEKYFNNLFRYTNLPIITLSEMGFSKSTLEVPLKEINLEKIKQYHDVRDFPAKNGTSKLSVHLRFGTLSIRNLVSLAKQTNEVWLNELIWREFYMMILWHFPHVVNGAFKPAYNQIVWRNNEKEFEMWCQGQTGYPIVDAGMRELNQTGYMHNRIRMIVASFLTKHLLIDWRWGEAYFAEKLLDFELSSNNGGWQWAAGSGCDAAPYFRVFNPHLQTLKFDKQLEYVKKWVPEFENLAYQNSQIVAHEFARKRALKVYSDVLKSSTTF